MSQNGHVVPERMPAVTEKPQQVTRIPPYRPGSWIKLKAFEKGEPGSDLSEAVRRVKSMTGSLTSQEQKWVVWRIHFEDGRCVTVDKIDRLATSSEIRDAQRPGVSV